LEYLRWDGDFLLDVRFEVAISSAPMRERGVPAMVVSRSRGTDLWWSMNQMLAHHTVSGCRMRAGDLIGSGTISGSGEDERGCLLELTWRGTKPITLPDGTERKFLQDGDEVILRGWAVREGLPKLSFGECRGIVLPVA
jgi:fumarylacetoacetase